MSEIKSTILVVDDSPDNVKVLIGILSEKYTIKVALNGEKALKLAGKKPPDLIMLDVVMPEMDGYEVCRRLKSMPELKEVPIIFLSGKTEVEDIIRGFELGAVDYVSKPFNATELSVRINTHLQIAFLQNELTRANEELEQRVVEKTTQVLHFEKIIHTEIDESFIRGLDDPKRAWFIDAIAGMLLADGKLDEREIAYLRKILTFLGNKNEAERMLGMIKTRETNPLKKISIGGNGAFEMLTLLMRVAAADGEVSPPETDFLFKAGKLMGLDFELIESVLSWGTLQMKADTEYQRLQGKLPPWALN